MHEVQLASGHRMPMLGLGTWDLRGEQCVEVVLRAIELGYTHIDTAWMYENQGPIGRAVRQCGVDRSELFITSKIWHTHLEHDEVLAQFEEILDQLQMDYVDLLLIHWPSKKSDPLQDTLRAFEKISAAGKTRSIGVSNFDVELVEQARTICQVPICVNQVEYYTHLPQQELLQHCIRHNVVLTAYRPLGKGGILQDPVLRTVAQNHGKTVAQVALKWLLQQGIIVIPKASSEVHLRQNMDLFDWELDGAEMQQIGGLSA